MVVPGTDTVYYTRFCHEHPWTLALDPTTTGDLMRRWERAVQLAADNRLMFSGQGRYYIPSQSSPDTGYDVTDSRGCPCPDGRPAGQSPYGWCKHRIACWIANTLYSDLVSKKRSAPATTEQ